MMQGLQVSAIVPARNEEANIAGAVESLAEQTVPVEIIVVNDGSTDRTGAILEELRQRLPQLRVLEAPDPPPGWTGKNYAAACGVEQSQAPWLLLTDADVRHALNGVEAGLAAARQTGAAMVSYSPDQELPTWWERATIPFVYCRLSDEYPYERVSDPEDPLAAANGEWLLVSRTAYNAVGGHAAVKEEMLEDVALARLLKRSGCRLYFARGVGLARSRMYRGLEEMWQGWSKNLFPLFGRRKGTVAGAVTGAALDTLVWLFLLVALYGSWAGWPVSRFMVVFLLAIIGWRHFRYGQALRRNRYPLACFPYYTLGSVLFAALMVNSASKYLRGEPVRWKGREYPVPLK
ncbi:MAG: glycosyltransferase [Acidobacteria bacterium]|nr:glycosyltransferase [Acidobacteriota bacterium]